MFDCEHGIALHAMQGFGLISRQGGSLMVFLDLRQKPGVYSRVMVGMAI